MAELLFVIIYFLIGYFIFQKGVEQYGGKEEYMKVCETGLRYGFAEFLVIIFWPVLTIKGLIDTIKERRE